MFLATIDPIDTLIRGWSEAYGLPIDAFAKLFLAMVAGGLVGLERELRGRQAGFRTNLLVCLGSALVMIVSTSFAGAPWPTPGEGMMIAVDPARIAYGVMTGIGFLGAGTIIKSGPTVRGLTTAAGLWCMAAVGLAAGFGLYVVSIMTTVLILLALWLLDYLEEMLPRLRFRNVVIRRAWAPGCVAETVRRFKQAGLDVVDASFERTADLENVVITMQVGFTDSRQYYNLERQLEGDQTYQLMATRET